MLSAWPISGNTTSHDRMVWGCWVLNDVIRSWPTLRHYTGICPDIRKKITKRLSQTSRSLHQNMNPGYPEYETNITHSTVMFSERVPSKPDAPHFCRITTCVNLNIPRERSVNTVVMWIWYREQHHVLQHKNVWFPSSILNTFKAPSASLTSLANTRVNIHAVSRLFVRPLTKGSQVELSWDCYSVSGMLILCTTAKQF